MKKGMLVLIVLASLIPGILAVLQYVDKEQKEKRNKINESALHNKIDSLNKSIQTLQLDNANLSHQLTETALKLNESVIGHGDIQVEISNSKPNEFTFRFVNDSDLPVIDAKIMVQDYNKIIICEKVNETEDKVFIKSNCYKGSFIKYPPINFNPNGAWFDSSRTYQISNDYMNYAIQIETRKKTIIYHLVYKVVKEELLCSYRIYNLVKGKKVLEKENNILHIPNDYWTKHFYEKVLYTI